MDNEGTVRIGIYDKGGGAFEKNARVGAIAVCDPDKVTALDVPAGEAVERLLQNTHIVCHLSGDRSTLGGGGPSWSSLLAGDLSTAHVILRVSSQGASGMMDSLRTPYRHEKGPWILHLVEPSGSVTIDQWQKIFLAIRALDTTQPELSGEARAMFDPSSERLALRLLCEAQLFSTSMRRSAPLTFVLGNCSVAAALSTILEVDRLDRSTDDSGWAWQQSGRKIAKEREAARLVIVAGSGAGVSQWIRWHRDARDCPLALRVGCLLFGMEPLVADELANRDVFGRFGVQGESFDDWSAYLALVDNRRKLPEILKVLTEIDTLHRSAWQRLLRASSCIPELTEVIRDRSMVRLKPCLAAANETDWDSVCFEGPGHEAHAWANRIKRWLAGVTAGVTPNWEEGLDLFAPLLDK